MKLSCIQLAIPFRKVVQNKWITICHPSCLKGQQNLPLGNCRKSVDWPGPNISQHRHHGNVSPGPVVLATTTGGVGAVVVVAVMGLPECYKMGPQPWSNHGSSHLVSKYFATMEFFRGPLNYWGCSCTPSINSLVMAYTYRGYTSYLLRKGDPPSTSCT